ncbi:MAG: LURP-one-related family protein [Promethearchaeota archaeon]
MSIKFCPKCGDPVEPGQNFCEKCGYDLRQVNSSGAQNVVASVSPSSTSTVSSGSLFDPSRNYYILQEKYWDWGSGPIMDEKGQKIGEMHRKVFSLRAKIEFRELDGTVSAAIHKKIIAIKPTYDLKDPQENLLARLSKTVFSVFRPKFYLENPQKEKIMVAQGKFGGFSFTVTDMQGNLLATIEKADKWRDIFLGGVFDFKDTYAVRIENPNVDRRLLLGFVIAIDNTLHDN